MYKILKAIVVSWKNNISKVNREHPAFESPVKMTHILSYCHTLLKFKLINCPTTVVYISTWLVSILDLINRTSVTFQPFLESVTMNIFVGLLFLNFTRTNFKARIQIYNIYWQFNNKQYKKQITKDNKLRVSRIYIKVCGSIGHLK